MKALKITAKNSSLIETALAEINGNASSFTVTDYRDVEYAAKRAEEQLALDNLPKAERTGALAHYTPEGPRANSYKYDAVSTRVTLERRPSGWFFIQAERCSVYPKQNEFFSLSITESQRDEIARRAVAKYSVQRAQEKAA